LQPRRPAQGLHARFAPQGLARAWPNRAEPVVTAPAIPTTTASGMTVDDSILFFNRIVSSMTIRERTRAPSSPNEPDSAHPIAVLGCTGLNPGHVTVMPPPLTMPLARWNYI